MIQIGDYSFHEPTGDLAHSGGVTLRLSPRSADVLVALLRADGEVVSREQLHETVWQGRIVTDVQVSKAISELRAAFNDDTDNPNYIETLPRRGYRLMKAPEASQPQQQRSLIYAGVAGVVVVIAVIGGVFFWPGPAVQQRQPTIVVLPFLNTGPENEDYFAQGISGDIRRGLIGQSGIKVLGRVTSIAVAQQYLGGRVDESLGVTHLIEGTVRSTQEQVSMTVTVLETADDSVIWEQKFDGREEELFDFLGEVNREVLSTLTASSSSPSFQRHNQAAYRAFLHGFFYKNNLQFDEAIAAYQRAIELEPSFADAYASLAQLYTNMVWFEIARVSEVQHQAMHYNRLALAIQPHNALALTGTALDDFFVQNEYQRGIDALSELCHTHPNNTEVVLACGLILGLLGHIDEGLMFFDHMVNLDPLSPNPYMNRGSWRLLNGDTEGASADLARASQLGVPMASARFRLATFTGDFDAAQAELNRADSEWSSPSHRMLSRVRYQKLTGSTSALNRAIDEYLSGGYFQSPLILARFESLKGNNEKAVTYYRTALDEGEFFALLFPSLRHEFEHIHHDLFADPGFEALLKERRIDAASLASFDADRLKAAAYEVRDQSRNPDTN